MFLLFDSSGLSRKRYNMYRDQTIVTMIVNKVKKDDQERVEKVRLKHPGSAIRDPIIIINFRSVNILNISPLGSESPKFVSITVGMILPHSPSVLHNQLMERKT